jgi:hypothetical protein
MGCCQATIRRIVIILGVDSRHQNLEQFESVERVPVLPKKLVSSLVRLIVAVNISFESK